MTAETQQAQRRNWIQQIDCLQQEHIALKNELAEAVKNSSDKRVLEKMEYFQNSFIVKDAVLALLRHDITIHHDEKTLQEDIGKMDIEFRRLASEFHEWLRASGLKIVS